MSELNKKKWRKILYEEQHYPDSYTDETIFLKDLRKNIYLKPINLWEACLGASLVLEEFFTVVSFLLIYFYIVNGLISAWKLLYNFTGISFIAYLIYKIKIKGQLNLGQDIRTVLTFIVFGQLFSPILHTLTDTVSTDTIHTVTFLMMLIHMIFYNYGIEGAAIVSKSLSLSAAIFASICLSSRLSSANEAFILLTLATQIFVLFPIFRAEIVNHSAIFIIILCIIDLYIIFYVSLLCTLLFVSVVLFIGIICPLLFFKHQKYKDNIYGPWDEAVIVSYTNT